MSFLPIGASVGWLAVLTGVVGTYVQRRRVTTNGAAGVSLATWTLFAFMGCFWITYGVVAHSAQVVAGSVLCLPIQLSIVVRLRPGVRWGVVARAFALFLACCVVPTAMLGWSGGVYGTGVAMTINRLPQLIELVRNADAGGAIGLLHAVTSPLAGELLLPWLAEEDRDAALGYVWQAVAALHVAYDIDRQSPEPAPDVPSADSLVDRALASGDEHAIKLTEAALRSFERTGEPALLWAAADASARLAG